MCLLHDIETRKDIERLLAVFYGTAMKDELIGRFFTEVVPLHLPTHLPLIADFWESVVLHGAGYRKNVMEIHRHIHLLSPIHREHLDRWVQVFTESVDLLFSGDKATLIKQRARSIATLMDIRLNHPGSLSAG